MHHHPGNGRRQARTAATTAGVQQCRKRKEIVVVQPVDVDRLIDQEKSKMSSCGMFEDFHSQCRVMIGKDTLGIKF